MSGQKHHEMIVDYMVCECGDLAYYYNHGTLTRCKDCRYRGKDERGMFCDNKDGLAWLASVEETDYCSCGKLGDPEKEEKDG